MIDYITEGSLVVVPGDRVDNILASVNAHLMTRRRDVPRIAGLLLTGGFVPHLSVVNILCEVDVPVLLTEEDTATAAFNVRSLVPKITARDKEKIELAHRLVEDYLDVDGVFGALGLPPADRAGAGAG
jgi:phosphate acetyltransferase